MNGILLYLPGLVIVLIWLRVRPVTTLARLLGLWWIGLILMRILPFALTFATRSSGGGGGLGILPSVVDLLAWIGALCILHALLGLTSWKRPRKTVFWWIWASLFALGWIVSLITYPRHITLWVLMGTPWLVWVRWRKDLGAGGLSIASLTGVVSLVLCGIVYGPGTPFRIGEVAPGILVFRSAVARFAFVYALIATIPAAVRIHLSIRRIGWRLFVSHLLAGTVPGGLAVIFLLIAGALFLSTYRGQLGAALLEDSSHGARIRLARYLPLPEAERPYPYGDEVSRQTVLTREDGEPVRVQGVVPPFSPATLLEVDRPSEQVPLLWDGKTLYLRARLDTLVDARPVRIEALAPVDSLRMEQISHLLGVPVRLNPRFSVVRAGSGISIGAADTAAVGAIGPGRFEDRSLPGGTIVSCLVKDSTGWAVRAIPVSSSAGLSEPIRGLLDTARKNPLATAVLVILGLVAALIVGAIVITIAMVFGMGRSITLSVRALTRAAATLGEGRLGHRIRIEGNDELWNVAASFNTMAEGLERMRAMEIEAQRLEEELRIAREIQNRLLPAEPPPLDHVRLAGLSLPAREVGGDYYDYIVLPGGRVGLAVADVSGKGAGAALLMSSFRASLRSQNLDLLGPARTMASLNRFVCASVDPGKFITAFLAVLDPARGELCYANGGHEPPLLIRDGGALVNLTEGGVILGAFADAEYVEGRAPMPPGSLLTIFTDGVTEARNVAGEFFGEERLAAILAAHQGEDCPHLLRRIVEEVHSFSGSAPQSDDITLLLARTE